MRTRRSGRAANNGLQVSAVVVTVALIAAGLTGVQSFAAPAVAAADAPTSAAIAPITLTPIADSFVTADNPGVNYGSKTFMDVYGGTENSCTAVNAPTVGLLKFDLSSIPAGAVVTGATLKVTTRAGYAQPGAVDQNHHLLRVSDTSWNENTLTWNSWRPSDPVPVPGSPLLADGTDIRKSSAAVGSISVARSCETTPTDQAKQFPTNGLGGSTGESMTFTQAETNFVAALANARSTPNRLVSFEIFTPATNGKSYWARYYTKEAGDAAVRPMLVLTFGTASVIQAVPVATTSGTGTAVTVKVSATPSTLYTVTVLSGSACVNGQLENPTVIGSFTAATDANGSVYTAGTVAGSSGFVAAYVTSTSGEISTPSACVRVGPDNDAWTRALPIALSTSGSGNSSGYVDTRGGSRWFRFPIQPGGKVKVDLKNLPADYDLAVFTDIAKAYTTLTSNTDLTRLSAEFAPSVFSPSVFSPDAYSPSVFSPDDYAPSVFSPSVFSPSVFSPSVFSPDSYSPSVFSPSVFSPSVFSPSVFSPSVFSPSVFSPSVFSSDGTAPSVFSPEAFASAQTRSLVGVSYTTGTGDEAVVANTWNNTGNFYVRVSGRNGVTSTEAPFSIEVNRDDLPACSGVTDTGAPPAPIAGTAKSLLFVDRARLLAQPGNTGATVTDLLSKLSAFALRGEVGGVVVDVSQDSRVAALNVQADAKPGCPYAKNLVAGAVKDIVKAYRAGGNPLKYIVLVGPDGGIPFFRYPDETLLGPESDYVPPVSSSSASEASLRLNYVLGQDEYGSTTTLNLGNAAFPVPDLAVGRLVETAAEASGMLDAYGLLNGGVTRPTSSLVTGYDFLTDAATSVQDDLSKGIGTAAGTVKDALIAPNNISPEDPLAWIAAQLRTKLFGSRHDITFLAGHFSANSALAADFKTSVLSSELAASTTDFVNTVVFSAGCHSGYNIVDGDAIPGVTVPLDWVQAFARKKATLIAGTGYQYGDTDFLEYSERIYSGFAKQLRYGTGPVSVGEALARAKQTYLEETPDVRGLHRKALLQSALFGLPMLSLDMPAGRIAAPARASTIGGTVGYTTNPGLTLGLSSADTSIAEPLTANTVPLTAADRNVPLGSATYYSGPDGVAANPVEPALPLVIKNVSVPGKVLRGVGFRGGSYTDDTSGIVPLTGAATTELRGAHVSFESPVFFPMRIATPNYYDALSGGGTTTLQVTPLQHKAIPNSDKAVLRKYDSVNLRLYYSANLTQPALSAAPSISGITAAVQGADVVFRASVTGNPAAGVQEVWVTYTGNSPSWTSLNLQQCVVTAAQPTLPSGCVGEESTLWIGRLIGGATGSDKLQFMVQAVNGVGLVTLDDALGAYYQVPTGGVGALTPSLLGISAPGTAIYGTTITASATLTSGGNPVPGKSVFFTIGSTRTTATTDGSGVATAVIPVKVLPGPSSVRASFAGDAGLRASAATSPLAVSKSSTSLTLTAVPGATPATPPGLISTLVDNNGKPLAARTVYLVFTGVGDTRIVPVITDYAGRGRLDTVTFEPGTYTVTAKFLGQIEAPVNTFVSDSTYLESQATATVTVVAVNDVKVGGPVAPLPSGMVGVPQTYNFTITNLGPDTAKLVTFTDVLPSNVTNASVSPTECTLANGTVTCVFPSLANGATQTVSITATPTAVGTLTNTASVSSGGVDRDILNNTASVSNEIRPAVVPPGTVTVTASFPPPVLAGTTYAATVSLSNSGTVQPAPTYSLVASPAVLSWLKINSTTGAVSGLVPLTGTTSFSYQVTASNVAGTNTSALITVAVIAPADLSVSGKAPGQFIGTPTTFQLLVANNSTFTSAGTVTVVSTFSTGLSYLSVAGTAWTCVASGGGTVVTCTLNTKTIDAKKVIDLYLTVVVNAPVGTATRLTAVVTPNDPVPANNTLVLDSSVKRKQ